MSAKRFPYHQWAPDARALDIVGDKWTLLIVRDLLVGPTRFVELQRRLPGISTEQLRTRLNMMVSAGLLTRERFREVPPRVDYALTEKARALTPVLDAVAEWGFSHAWGEPARTEAVDVTALFRLLPATLTDLPAGERVVLEISDQDDTPHYVVSWVDARIDVAMDPLVEIDEHTTLMCGTRRRWIDAILAGDEEVVEIEGSLYNAYRVMRALSGKAGVKAIGKAAA